MKRTIVECDRCGQPNAMSVSVPVGKHDDPNHGSSDRYESFDVCGQCAIQWLSRAVEELPLAENLKTIDAFRAFRKTVKAVKP